MLHAGNCSPREGEKRLSEATLAFSAHARGDGARLRVSSFRRAFLAEGGMAAPTAVLGPAALGQSGPGSMAPWCSVSSGPSRYVLGMQELFRGHSKTREFPAHSAKVHSVAWSCDGRRLASGSFDKTASVFLLEKDRLVSL